MYKFMMQATVVDGRSRPSMRPMVSEDIWKCNVIKKVVTSYFRVSFEELKIKNKRKYVLPRDVFCYLVKSYTRSIVDKELVVMVGMERSLVSDSLRRIRFLLWHKLYEYQDVINCEELVKEKLGIE